MTSSVNHHGLPSPIASANSPAPSVASTLGGRPDLPNARQKPLAPGSQKAIALIHYLDDKVLRITRRYGKKFTDPESDRDDAPGYTSMDQAIADLDPLIDLAWASGTLPQFTIVHMADHRDTATIQIPYLLSFAGTVMSYMQAFPFSIEIFKITKKLDTAFAALLQGTSGPAIRAHPVSTTEKVRMKSLVVETKLTAVYVASLSGHSTELKDDSDDETDDDPDDDTQMDVDEDEDNLPIALAISRIYKSTIEILGDSLA